MLFPLETMTTKILVYTATFFMWYLKRARALERALDGAALIIAARVSAAERQRDERQHAAASAARPSERRAAPGFARGAASASACRPSASAWRNAADHSATRAAAALRAGSGLGPENHGPPSDHERSLYTM